MASSTKSLWPRLILLGDSITEWSYTSDGRWGVLLANSFQRRCDVIPRGFGGYNTRQFKSICLYVPVESLRAEVAVLFLGANDACEIDQQYVPLDEYKENLAYIVDYMKTTVGVSEVVILTPPPADTASMPSDLAVGRSDEVTEQYANACIEAAQDIGVPYVDLHTLFKQQDNWQSLLIDGLHPSESGSNLIYSAVYPVVSPLIAQVGPQNMEEGEQILPPFDSAENVFPCPDIENWVLDHPMPEDVKAKAKTEVKAKSKPKGK